MQNQHNNIEDSDNIKFLLIYMRKIQNTAEVRILAINKIASSVKIAENRKKSDVSILKRVI